MFPLSMLGWIALAAATILLILATILAAEVVGSLRRRPRRRNALGPTGRVVVLVPAHDEAAGIANILQSIATELPIGARILVVADNCSDGTASIVASAGIEVVERNDPTLRGKGYALDFGLRHLSLAPPDVVIVNDADCTPAPGSLHTVAALAMETNRPIQGLYLMERPPGELSPYLRVALFAWKLKNMMRPLGLMNFGLPCQLTGTGMAFPWGVLSRTNLHTGDLVEDIALGLECATLGSAPVFCPDALFTSPFPANPDAQESQRSRWEAGHLNTIGRRVPQLLALAVRTKNRDLFFMACDIALPPLAFFSFATGVVLLVSAFVALLGGSAAALGVALLSAIVFATAITIAWWRIGKDIISLREFGLIPGYILSKAMLYVHVIGGRQFKWIRSRRD